MRPFGVLACVVPLLATGCFTANYVKSDGPVQADGVAVSLVAEQCRDESDEPQGVATEDAGPPDASAMDVQLTIEVGNASSNAVTVDPHKAMLMVGGDLSSAVGAEPASSLAPGGKRVLQLRFHKATHLPCDGTLQVVLNRMVRLGARDVPLRAVSYQPTHG